MCMKAPIKWLDLIMTMLLESVSATGYSSHSVGPETFILCLDFNAVPGFSCGEARARITAPPLWYSHLVLSVI